MPCRSHQKELERTRSARTVASAHTLPQPLQGPDFVMVCSDTRAAHSIISIKQDEDKIVEVDSHKLLGIAGEAGDRVNFSEFIIANVKLYALKNSTELTTKSVAHFTRGELAKALRSVSRTRVLVGRRMTLMGFRHLRAWIACKQEKNAHDS